MEKLFSLVPEIITMASTLLPFHLQKSLMSSLKKVALNENSANTFMHAFLARPRPHYCMLFGTTTSSAGLESTTSIGKRTYPRSKQHRKVTLIKNKQASNPPLNHQILHFFLMPLKLISFLPNHLLSKKVSNALPPLNHFAKHIRLIWTTVVVFHMFCLGEMNTSWWSMILIAMPSWLSPSKIAKPQPSNQLGNVFIYA